MALSAFNSSARRVSISRSRTLHCRDLFTAKLIIAWLDSRPITAMCSVKVDRKRKIGDDLLRAIGRRDDLFKLFEDVDTSHEHRYLQS
jgi:hypothetical protein